MQTLYDTLLKYGNFKRYDELFITDIVVEDKRFVACWAFTRRPAKPSPCAEKPC